MFDPREDARRDNEGNSQSGLPPISKEDENCVKAGLFCMELGEKILRKNLELLGISDSDLIESVVREWQTLSLQKEASPAIQSEHPKILDPILRDSALGLELTEAASWHDVLKRRFEEFEDSLALAEKEGWDFTRVLEIYGQNQHIDIALKCGADPGISHDALSSLLDEKIWERKLESEQLKFEMDIQLTELNERARKQESEFAKYIPVVEGVRASLKLPGELSPIQVMEHLDKVLKEGLSQILGFDTSEMEPEELFYHLKNLPKAPPTE